MWGMDKGSTAVLNCQRRLISLAVCFGARAPRYPEQLQFLRLNVEDLHAYLGSSVRMEDYAEAMASYFCLSSSSLVLVARPLERRVSQIPIRSSYPSLLLLPCSR
jgi:hypothetical protein